MNNKATVLLLICIALSACGNIHRVDDSEFRSLIQRCGRPGSVSQYRYLGCKYEKHTIELWEMNIILPGESVVFYKIKDVELSNESRTALLKMLGGRAGGNIEDGSDNSTRQIPLDWKWL